MREAYLTESILYYAKISFDDEKYKPKLYKGICEELLTHKKSFNVEKHKNETKLSTKYWKLANKELHPRIFWSINHTTPIQEDEVCVCIKN